jgi:hypothetical protein
MGTSRRIAAMAVVALSSLLFVASIRSEGKYCGVVVYDRWGGCTLYSGVYVMYISEKVKEQLRPYVGQCVQIDARRVHQPENPGDGLISDLSYLGAAPEHAVLGGLSLDAAPAFENGEPPRIKVVLRNKGAGNIDVRSEEWAPTLLTRKPEAGKSLCPSDGPSCALLTRQAFASQSDDKPRVAGNGVQFTMRYDWHIDAAVPKVFTLKAGDERTVMISFEVPKGEYDFLSGYGGRVHEGKCIASNLVAFDVDADGKGTLVSVPNR